MSSEDPLKASNDLLQVELLELRAVIEDNELMRGGSASSNMSQCSIFVPKDGNWYVQEILLQIKRYLDVELPGDIDSPLHYFTLENALSKQSEYTYENITLILYQFYIDRIFELSRLKYYHLLRWNRFCKSAKKFEELIRSYRLNLNFLTDEYLDASHRAERLQVARESIFCTSKAAQELIQPNDLLIFLRHLICKNYSHRTFRRIYYLIKWLPYARKETLNLQVFKTSIIHKNMEASILTPSGTEAVDTHMIEEMDLRTFSNKMPFCSSQMYAACEGLRNLDQKSIFRNLYKNCDLCSVSDLQMILPEYTNNLDQLRAFLLLFCFEFKVNYNVMEIKSRYEEVEMHAIVLRRFKEVFKSQLQFNQFGTYDYKQEYYNAVDDNESEPSFNEQIFIKPATWLTHCKLKPKSSCYYTSVLTKIKDEMQLDELLVGCNSFMQLDNVETVLNGLRKTIQVCQKNFDGKIANPKDFNVMLKKIYLNTEKKAASSSTQFNQSSYSYSETMRNYGLQDAHANSDEATNDMGCHMSFMELRFLKTMELRKHSLLVLNYFRSIERTITIDDQGLTVDPLNKEAFSKNVEQSHRANAEVFESHSYLYDSVKDCRVSEAEFMEFTEVINRDDFYFHKDALVFVRDNQGKLIIYDEALKDFQELESDLIYIGTYFIQNSANPRKQLVKPKNNSEINHELVKMYSLENIDRFGVLYDIWTAQTGFLQAKKELVELYMEAYLNVISRDAKRKLAQAILNVIYECPKVDFYGSTYFFHEYRLHVTVLKEKAQIMRHIISQHITEQRQYLATLELDSESPKFGCPLPVPKSCHVFPHSDRTTVKTVGLMEFFPFMSFVGYLAETIDFSSKIVFDLVSPVSIAQELSLEVLFFRMLYTELGNMNDVGSSYTPALQRDLFNGAIADNATTVDEFLSAQMDLMVSQAAKGGGGKQIGPKLLEKTIPLINALTLRNRLIDDLWECEILSKIYFHHCNEYCFSEAHLFISPRSFENAKTCERIKRPKFERSCFMNEDNTLDKMVPNALQLAASDVDDSLIKFSYRSSSSILELCDAINLSNVQAVRTLQLAHKNLLISNAIIASKKPSQLLKKAEKEEHDFSISSVDKIIPFVSVQLEKKIARDAVHETFLKGLPTGGVTALAKNMDKYLATKRTCLDSYCNILNKRSGAITLRGQLISLYGDFQTLLSHIQLTSEHFFIMNSQGLESIKSPTWLLSEYTKNTEPVLRPESVLSPDAKQVWNVWYIPKSEQIFTLYQATDGLDEFEEFALNRHFVLVQIMYQIVCVLVGLSKLGLTGTTVCNRSGLRASTLGMVSEFESSRFSPPELVWTYDSKKKIDLSVSESPTLSKDKKTLNHLQKLVKFDMEKSGCVDYDGGPMSSLASELRLIQQEIDELEDPLDYNLVVKLLRQKRDTMLLKIDLLVKFNLPEAYLLAGKQEAFDLLQLNSANFLKRCCNKGAEALYEVDFAFPEPLQATDSITKRLFPVQAFRMSHCNLMLPTNIERIIMETMGSLKTADKITIHSESLALDLQLEDVRTQGWSPKYYASRNIGPNKCKDLVYLLTRPYKQRYTDFPNPDMVQTEHEILEANNAEATGKIGHTELLLKHLDENKDETLRELNSRTTGPENMTLSLTPPSANSNPIDRYTISKLFLMMALKMKYMRLRWARTIFTSTDLDNVKDYRQYVAFYKTEKLFPLLRSLQSRYSFGDNKFSIASLNVPDVILLPNGVPEVVLVHTQLVNLVESLQFDMLQKFRKQVARKLDFAVKERSRMIESLPTDLWKKSGINESLSIPSPALSENLTAQLIASVEGLNDPQSEVCTIPKKELQEYLQTVANSCAKGNRELHERYSIYYESLLSSAHQVIYSNERKIAFMEEELRKEKLSASIKMKFEMHQKIQDLLIEVIGIRKLLNELLKDKQDIERKAKDQVRREFCETLQNLFSLCYEQKSMLEVFRADLFKDATEHITSIRDSTFMELQKIRNQLDINPSESTEILDRSVTLSQDLAKWQKLYANKHQALVKTKAASNWKLATLRSNLQKQIQRLTEELSASKLEINRANLVDSQKIDMLESLIKRLEDQLASSERELHVLYEISLKETQLKIAIREELDKKVQVDAHMDKVRQVQIDQLQQDRNNFENRLKVAENQAEMVTRKAQEEGIILSRNLRTVEKALHEERKLKRLAMHTANQLQRSMQSMEKRNADAESNQVTSLKSSQVGTKETMQTARSETCTRARFKQVAELLRPTSAGHRDLKHTNKPYTPDHFAVSMREIHENPKLTERIARSLMHPENPPTHEDYEELHGNQEK